jgi:hypothetical protein
MQELSGEIGRYQWNEWSGEQGVRGYIGGDGEGQGWVGARGVVGPGTPPIRADMCRSASDPLRPSVLIKEQEGEGARGAGRGEAEADQPAAPPPPPP